MKRYFTRNAGTTNDYYIVIDGQVKFYFSFTKAWFDSVYSLSDLTNEKTIGKITEYEVEEFVLLCPFPLI